MKLQNKQTSVILSDFMNVNLGQSHSMFRNDSLQFPLSQYIGILGDGSDGADLWYNQVNIVQ